MRFTRKRLNTIISRDLSKLQLETLENTEKDTTIFSLENYKTFGKVVSEYDGDSVDIVMFINEDDDEPRRFKCRLNGIDCAEKRSKDEYEQIHAIRALNYVREYCHGKIVYIHCHKFDKYGRLLVDIYRNIVDKKSLNDLLVEMNLACVYKGGKKRPFRDWAEPRFYQSERLGLVSPKIKKDVALFDLDS